MANLTLSVGLVNVPVAIEPLARDASVRGKMCCPVHMEPCKRGEMVCSHGHTVEKTVTGYQMPDGSFETLPDREMFRAERTAIAELEYTVQVQSIDPLYFEKTYLVRPGKGGEPSYDLLAAALKKDGRALVGKVVLSKNTRALVVRWSETAGCLLAHLCTFNENVRWHDVRVTATGMKERPAPSAAYMKVAGQLLEGIADEFKPEAFHDDYQQRLRDAILALAEGRSPEPVEDEPVAAPTGDIMSALQASVEALRSKPSKGKADGKLTKKELAEKNPLAPASVKKAAARPRRPKKAA